MRSTLKYIINRAGLGQWLNSMLFNFSRLKYGAKNRQFKRSHPQLVLPPDEWIFETFALDYGKFWDDGRLAAMEIHTWVRPYLPTKHNHILDWGCGVARISRHLPELWLGQDFHACDTNAGMIGWDKLHCPGISFSIIGHDPPTHFEAGQFQFIFGFSVLTHIDASAQSAWLAEMHRLLAPGGVLLVTTHGSFFESKLTGKEKKYLSGNGSVTHHAAVRGHRMLATYNDAAAFREMISSEFEVLEFFDGKSFPIRAGGQDWWLLKSAIKEK